MSTSILITGSKGQLGSELKDLSNNYPLFNFIFTDLDELDITDKQKVSEFISQLKPEWIVNCAGYTNVDKAESEPARALSLNGTSLFALTESLAAYDGKLIHLSSDFVFDGSSITPYTEEDRANPVSVYGKSKLEGDKIALSYPNALVLRTSWLYSGFGHNFVKTIIRLSSQQKSIGVVNDQLGTPTSALDLAELIISIISASESGITDFKPGLYNYSNEGSCTWYEFACSIRDIMGLELEIKAIKTSEYPLPAKRPLYSVLDKTKIKSDFDITIPAWKSSLEICLKKIKSEKDER